MQVLDGSLSPRYRTTTVVVLKEIKAKKRGKQIKMKNKKQYITKQKKSQKAKKNICIYR